MKVGLYFGSFNPVHIGHLLLATHIREAANLDEIWFVVSPQNPFKQNSDLAAENHRLEMVKIAVENTDYFKVSDVEFNLPKPSYTYITLKHLKKEFPDYDFKLIIGKDNLEKFNEWKEAEWIKNNIEILAYNRSLGKRQKTKGNTMYDLQQPTTKNLPLFDISSTEIRNRIKNKLSIRYFVTDAVNKYIKEKNLYK